MSRATFAPKPMPYRVIVLVGVLGVLGLAFVARGEVWLPVVVVGGLVLLIGCLLFALLFSRNTRIILEPGWIVHRDPIGRTRRIAARSIAAVIRVDNFVVRGSRRKVSSDTQLFLLNAEGVSKLRLRSSVWGLEALSTTRIAALPAPEIVHDRLTPGEMRTLYPSAVAALEARPNLAALIGAAVIVVIAGGVAAAFINR